MRRALILAAFAVVPACGDWPDLGLDSEGTGEARLVPFDEVVSPGETHTEEAEATTEAAEDLLDRAEALRDRADALAPGAEDRAAFDALVARPRPGE